MRIVAIQIENIRCFQKLPKTELSRSINVFVGPNNSGKSTLLNCIFYMQRQVLNANDTTIGRTESKIELFYEGSFPPLIPDNQPFDKIKIQIFKNGSIARTIGKSDDSLSTHFEIIPEMEPLNLIYPYLSKRKTVDYKSEMTEKNANAVMGNFENLYSKIDRLITPQLQPGNQQYVNACNNILGFVVSSLAKGGGKKAVYFIHNLEHIPLTCMGEGVANILGIITDLCVAEDRIFIIEEPENDIHPKALKALLNLIIEKSSTNQFFISTHSNIVMKYLGGVSESKVFYVNNNLRDDKRKNLFISTLKLVLNNYEERRNLLEDLGYDFFDFDLWKAWLFLEESSAEIIIKDYLIDWFVKPLKNQIRTFSSSGSANLIPRFEDFNKLFVFLHLEPTYKNRVWVLLDGGEEESKIIQKLRDKYVNSGWNDSNFKQFTHHDFERYYPLEFQPKVNEILKINDKNKKREEKRKLIIELKDWINEDRDKARAAFKISANEIIEHLKLILEQINKSTESNFKQN